MDSLEDRQKSFFANCSKNKLKGSEKDEYESIRKEYQKVIHFSVFRLVNLKQNDLVAYVGGRIHKRKNDLSISNYRLLRTQVKRFN